MVHTIEIQTSARDQVVDITADVRRIVAESMVRDGICLVYCPHTTAGVVVNEGYDPDVARDVLAYFDRAVPWDGPYRHAEGNAAAHIKAMMCGSSQTIPIGSGRLQLGTWQAIQFMEFDGPRLRKLAVRVQGAGT